MVHGLTGSWTTASRLVRVGTSGVGSKPYDNRSTSRLGRWLMPDPLLILHLSDLHFGNHSRFAGKDMTALGKAFHKAVEATKADLEISPRLCLVIATGDIAETGKKKEFDQGRQFLTALAGELGLEPRRFVFVPGNHDISWPECLKVEADQKEEEFGDDELKRRLDEVKFLRYEEFLRGFYAISDLTKLSDLSVLKRGAYLHDFPDLRLSVAALNSCERESHRRDDHRGELSDEQAQSLMTSWRAPKYDDWLKIVAVHHNPVTTSLPNIQSWSAALKAQGGAIDSGLIDRYESDVVGFGGKEHLKTIVLQDTVQLVLHGHHHARDRATWETKGSGFAHVLSTGSFSLKADQLPGDEPLSVQLIVFDLDKSKTTLRAFPLAYSGRFHLDGEILPGGFRLDPDEPGIYEKALVLPTGFKRDKLAIRPPKARGGDPGPFVRSYRQRLGSAFCRWDLRSAGVAQAGGVGRPIEADLDKMYQPLRLAEFIDNEYTVRGAPLGPEQLLARHRH